MLRPGLDHGVAQFLLLGRDDLDTLGLALRAEPEPRQALVCERPEHALVAVSAQETLGRNAVQEPHHSLVMVGTQESEPAG